MISLSRLLPWRRRQPLPLRLPDTPSAEIRTRPLSATTRAPLIIATRPVPDQPLTEDYMVLPASSSDDTPDFSGGGGDFGGGGSDSSW